MPDECEADCDADGLPDDCEEDCNNDGIPNDCEGDCDFDGVPDGCEADCDLNGIPDDCEDDCDGDGLIDACEEDCDGDGVPNDCEPDCDADGVADPCELDLNMNLVPDDCELDCDGDLEPDMCEEGPIEFCAMNLSQDPNDPCANLTQPARAFWFAPEFESLGTTPRYYAWETPGSFVENGDGTATLTGVIVSIDDANRTFEVQINLSDRVDPTEANHPPAGSPATSGSSLACGSDATYYRYYQTISGELTGGGDLDGAHIQIVSRGPAFQKGIGANIVNGNFGASLWMDLIVTAQPSSSENELWTSIGDLNTDLACCCELDDCDLDGIPDADEADCDQDGKPDDCEVDCDGNGIPDDCEPDCDKDGTPDGCEVDEDLNGIPDECEVDCDGDNLNDYDECNYGPVSTAATNVSQNAEDACVWLPAGDVLERAFWFNSDFEGLGTPTQYAWDGSGLLVENTDGTAILTGTIVGLHDTSAKFTVEIYLSGRVNPGDILPLGSPSYPNAPEYPYGCADDTNWRYYTSLTGTLTGTDGSMSGAVVTVTRRGPAWQQGVGGNLLNGENGASAWIDVTIDSQPSSSGVWLDPTIGDINTDLECVCLAEMDEHLPVSLKGVTVPEPTELDHWVVDKDAAIALGKALFWDQQVGSDGKTACATCHFHAGVDSRTLNTTHPGANGLFDTVMPGDQLDPANFPFHKLADPHDADSSLLHSFDDVVGSQGVRRRDFAGVNLGVDSDFFMAPDPPEMVFLNATGNPRRQVTGRQAPTTHNAVFNVRNFWDGRANFHFNGSSPFGPRDPDAQVYVNFAPAGNLPTTMQVHLDFAALASQAVGPALSGVEMSWFGRTFPDLGQKMLVLQPLGLQTVHADDSVFGPTGAYASLQGGGTLVDPMGGLSTTYGDLITAAFKEKLYNGGDVWPIV